MISVKTGDSDILYYMNKELLAFSQNFIKERYMAVVACVSEGKPRSFTCWYQAYNGSLYWKSRTGSIHSTAFEQNPDASLCIYDHDASYPDNKTGVQVIGTVRKVTSREEMEKVVQVFANKFGEQVLQKNSVDVLCAEDTQSTFYCFTPQQIKLVSKAHSVHMEQYEDFIL